MMDFWILNTDYRVSQAEKFITSVHFLSEAMWLLMSW